MTRKSDGTIRRLIRIVIAISFTTVAGWSLFPNWKNSNHCQRRDERNSKARLFSAAYNKEDSVEITRRKVFLKTLVAIPTVIVSDNMILSPHSAIAAIVDEEQQVVLPVDVVVSGDAKKLFNEGRALESQGNMAAAQRLYSKVTQIAPRFIYGYSNLGNTQTALGDLANAEKSYTKSIDLCNENLQMTNADRRCTDLYLLLLNRGCIRLNNGMPAEGLQDLQLSNTLRARPDSIVLQNLARAEELNGYYQQSDRDYTVAISMTAGEVNPFWLRSALVKYQIGDYQAGFDLLKRVENRFPEAPEVRAAYAVFLYTMKNDPIAAQRKFLEIPDRQRLKYVDTTYLTKVISWPPKMLETLAIITKAVGDTKKV